MGQVGLTTLVHITFTWGLVKQSDLQPLLWEILIQKAWDGAVSLHFEQAPSVSAVNLTFRSIDLDLFS